MFLDRCDICHKAKICKGYNNKVICLDCIKQFEKKDKYNKPYQLSIFDIGGMDDEKRRII